MQTRHGVQELSAAQMAVMNGTPPLSEMMRVTTGNQHLQTPRPGAVVVLSKGNGAGAQHAVTMPSQQRAVHLHLHRTIAGLARATPSTTSAIAMTPSEARAPEEAAGAAAEATRIGAGNAEATPIGAQIQSVTC